jgi:glutamine amidotransferase
MKLAIIDSGGANIASVRYAIERLGVQAELTTDPERVRSATHVILPGVGMAADCNRLALSRPLSSLSDRS